MKGVISVLVAASLFVNVAMADCDFSTGITPGPNHTFIYSEDCHQKVGQLVQDNKTKDAQLADYAKAIDLKDLAIKKADERANMWMDTSTKLEDRLTKVDELQSKNNFIYYGLGILTVLAAGYVVRAAYR